MSASNKMMFVFKNEQRAFWSTIKGFYRPRFPHPKHKLFQHDIDKWRSKEILDCSRATINRFNTQKTDMVLKGFASVYYFEETAPIDKADHFLKCICLRWETVDACNRICTQNLQADYKMDVGEW